MERLVPVVPQIWCQSLVPLVWCFCTLVPKCHYVQTHKNIAFSTSPSILITHVMYTHMHTHRVTNSAAQGGKRKRKNKVQKKTPQGRRGCEDIVLD